MNIKTGRGGERIRVGRVPFEVTTMDDAVDTIVGAALVGGALPVRLSNAYCVALAENDPKYCTLLNGQGLNFPDGLPVVWAMRMRKASGNYLPGRVRGPSLFRNVIDRGRSSGLRHFLLGTTSDTLARLVSSLERDFPGVVISGSYAPPFSPLNNDFVEKCHREILKSDANLVWVGLGTPKQDYVALELSSLLGVPCVGVGAAFDFSAGVVKEAPEWIQRSGFEWLYRLASDPRRLWKRYLIGNIQFIKAAVRG